jgi:hypothetical protein
MPSGTIRSRRLLRGSLVAAGCLLGASIVLYALVVVVLGEAPEWATTAQICRQPNTVAYDESSYSVVVRQPSFSLSLSPGPTHAVVGRSGGSSGVFVELNGSTDPDEVTCRWDPDGVEIIEPNGITHTVPATVFIGGR